jgi:hypothetical protein
MKKSFLLFIVASFATLTSLFAQEFRIITTVESIVASGLGRSRMLDHQLPQDYKPLTTSRTDGKKSDMGDVKREDVRIEKFDETKLLNFYNLGGINFQNIVSNDAVVASRLTEMAKEGWQLIFVASGVESDGGKNDNEGIFITRYIFKRDTAQQAQN